MGIRLGDDLWTLNMQMREEGVDDNVRAETQRPGGAGVGYQGMMEKHRRRPSWGAGRGGGVASQKCEAASMAGAKRQ